MGVEIERKFLLSSAVWRSDADAGLAIKQGYIKTVSGATVRVRIYGNSGYITLKSVSNGISRSEYEYEIPVADAEAMLKELCGDVVEKIRYKVIYDGKCWEIDVFSGLNQGLEVAEIELNSETEEFLTPSWIGDEVTNNRLYGNGSLSVNPYCLWKDAIKK